tara:strand:- start:357 stop:560 length:204 start_codon:yes stop_codon:yes gene_type:complete
MELDSVKSVRIETSDDLFLEVQNPNRFYGEFAEFVLSKNVDIRGLKATDTSAEPIFDYLMERSSKPG